MGPKIARNYGRMLSTVESGRSAMQNKSENLDGRFWRELSTIFMSAVVKTRSKQFIYMKPLHTFADNPHVRLRVSHDKL
jgi:hypothetical protein